MLPCLASLASWQVMPSPEPSLGCGRVDRGGSVAILVAWGAPVGLKKADLPWPALPCQPALGVLLLEDSSSA